MLDEDYGNALGQKYFFSFKFEKVNSINKKKKL